MKKARYCDDIGLFYYDYTVSNFNRVWGRTVWPIKTNRPIIFIDVVTLLFNPIHFLKDSHLAFGSLYRIYNNWYKFYFYKSYRLYSH